MNPSQFLAAAPVLRREPFDDANYVYELKQDGFRALAHIGTEGCALISRRGNVYKSFRSLCHSLASLSSETVLDGEIVVLDSAGRPKFYDLLRRRGEPIFYAFDCLMHRGRDLRELPLVERKRILAHVVGAHPRILVAQHFAEIGCDLFRLVCENDLEGIVAKRKDGAYGHQWFKIRNPNYTQYQGRRELFEKRHKAAL